MSVPVSKEKLVIERVPAEGTATTGGISDVGEQVEEITLREERVVVGKETVAVEQVRVGVQEVTEEQEVTETVRRERVELEDATEHGVHGLPEGGPGASPTEAGPTEAGPTEAGPTEAGPTGTGPASRWGP